MSSSTYPWNSAYTPFFRRFTDERSRDIHETIELYNDVRAKFYNSVWCNPNAVENLSDTLADELCKIVDLPGSHELGLALDKCQRAVLALETTIFSFPEINWSQPLGLKDQVDLRRFLRAKQHFLQNDDRIIETLVAAIGNVMGGIIRELPAAPQATDDAVFTAPLITVVPNPNELVAQIIGTLFATELADACLFDEVQTRFYENACEYSGVEPYGDSKKRIIPPLEADLSPQELVDQYLAGTPFQELLLTPFPVSIPEDLLTEQNKPPYDPDHPKHHCYQCHRPLPPDFAMKYWQVLAYPRGPFFDVEKCKITALNRHISGGVGPTDAYANLVVEYNLYVHRYDDKKREKDAEVLRKEEDKQDQTLRRELEAQERREERDYRDWLRDQDRAETEWKREQERLQKEQEKEVERLAEEQARQDLTTFRPIPEHIRVHTAIIAKTGWGKTQLIQHLILDELKKPDPASLIVLDSTGQMVGQIQRLALFNERLRDRIVIIDPALAPSLNMFDLSNPRFETYTPEQKEDIQTEIVSLFNYVFGAQDYDLSGQMGLAFAYSTRLMLSRQGSTIRDLRRLLEENPRRGWEESAYRDDIEKLDEDAKDFFKLHFYTDTLRTTKSGIARRLQLMIAIPAFRRMFITSKNALDLYDETQNKASIILVNTNEQMLKDGGYVLFGRYIIARTMAAILERALIPRNQRRTTHLIIDEGSPYMDGSFDALLTRVRQFGLKVTIAFQHFQQLTERLRNAVAGQTSVKYAGGLSYTDARFLANEMRCEPEFLMDLQTDISLPPTWAEFAVYADNWTTKHPMKLNLPFYALDNQPMMSAAEHTALLARNSQRIPSEAQKAPEGDLHGPATELLHRLGPMAPPNQPQTPPKSSSTSGFDIDTGEHTDPATKW